MLPLPTRFAAIILAFAPLFVHRSWRHAQNLLVGAILTPGQRTVTSVLRIIGRAQERRFVNVGLAPLNRLFVILDLLQFSGERFGGRYPSRTGWGF